jgi:sulfur carrier protein
MKVVLRNPRREVEVAGNRRVKEVLKDLDILPESVLVIRGDDLVTADQMLREDDVIELRPVMSGGSEPLASRTSHPRCEPGSRTPLQ